jgi:hypothetical protein
VPHNITEEATGCGRHIPSVAVCGLPDGFRHEILGGPDRPEWEAHRDTGPKSRDANG